MCYNAVGGGFRLRAGTEKRKILSFCGLKPLMSCHFRIGPFICPSARSCVRPTVNNLVSGR